MNNINNTIFEKFKEIASRLVILKKEVISSLKINKTYHKILSILNIQDGLTQSCLGEVCDMDRPAISRLVNKMENEELLSRNLKNGNKKNMYIELTQKGKALAEKIRVKMEELKSKFFAELKDNDKKVLSQLLDKTLIEIK